MYPHSGCRSGGTSAKTTLLENHPLVNPRIKEGKRPIKANGLFSGTPSWWKMAPLKRPVIRKRKKHVNINKCGRLSGTGWVPKSCLCVLFEVIPCGGERTHKQNPQKIPGQSQENFVYVFFYSCERGNRALVPLWTKDDLPNLYSRRKILGNFHMF